MDTRKANKLEMYHAVRAQLETIAAETDVPNLPRKLAEFASALDRIATLTAAQTQPLEGALAARDQAFAELAEDTLTVAGLVLVFAEERERPELAALVRVKPSHFAIRHMRQPVLAERVHAAAASVLPELASCGVTPPMLAALHDRIVAAREAMARPWSLKNQKCVATAQLTLAFQAADRLLRNQLDPLLFPLRRTHPELYAAYLSVRAIVHRRGPRRAAAEQPAATPVENIAPAPIAAPTEASAGTPATETPPTETLADAPHAASVPEPASMAACGEVAGEMVEVVPPRVSPPGGIARRPRSAVSPSKRDGRAGFAGRHRLG